LYCINIDKIAKLHSSGCHVKSSFYLCWLENTSSIRLIKLLSARGIASVALSIPMLNISHDDAKCRHNRPLYVITQDETFRLKQVSLYISNTRRENDCYKSISCAGLY
jgi:hypothetical protein